MFEPYRQAIAKELDVCFPADVPERVFLLRYEALQALRRQLDKYAADWIRPDLLDAIAAKKLAFLREARTKQQVKEILKFTPPRFDGNQYVPQSAYHVPEEELLY